MKTLLVSAALGLAVSLSAAPAFAGQQATSAQADNALNWSVVGGRGALYGARAEVVRHPGFTGAYDMIDPPAGSAGATFSYGADRVPYASEGGKPSDFQLQGQ